MRSYKATMVSPLTLPDRQHREHALVDAGYNVFNLHSSDVYVDLLTDSGTGTMSDAQWAALLRGDEAYAGSSSFAALETAVEDVMGVEHVVPAHQGRGAENALYGVLVEEGDVVPNNAHFDTTRAHVANQGATPVDCPVPGARDPDYQADFLGDLDVDRLRALADEHGAERIPAIILTITNNSTAGQPVSIENTRQVAEIAADLDATFVVDACRFAENAFFVRAHEAGYETSSVADIAREQLSYADAVVMSGKKDGLVNIGGFVGIADGHDDLLTAVEQRAILYEGFTTYGGMAGRDLAAFAVGLREAVDPPYVRERVEQVHALADMVEDAGIPVYRPVGGHAVYLDAGSLFDHLDATEFPGQALVCELYREGAVRGVELGSFAFPDTDRPELVRLAVPRRMYHKEHLEHVAETAARVAAREDVPGYEVVSEPAVPELRHFSAELRPTE
jgi:tryptophanase